MWILDSGATNHMSYDLNLFSSYHKITAHDNNTITIPDGTSVHIKHVGSVNLNHHIILQNVLHVPNFHFHLISISKLCEDLNCTISFTNNSCCIQAPSLNRPIQLGRLKKGLYYYQNDTPSTPNSTSIIASTLYSCNSAQSNINLAKLWHLRIGHAPFSVIKHVQPSLNISDYVNTCLCKICPAARQNRLPFGHSTIKSTVPFELLHIDTWGPYRNSTHNGCTLFLTIVDDYTRVTWLFLMKNKSEAVIVFQSFYAYVSTQFHIDIKGIRSDNAPDLCEGKMKIFLSSKGIIHHKTCANTPQQNGVVERKHKYLLETARALCFQSNLPIHFWGDCVLTAAYLINRMPLQSLGFVSPYEKLFKTTPDIAHLKAFGCLCFMTTSSLHRHKFDNKAHPCIFLGYPNLQKAYKVYDMVDKKNVISRDVIFYEQHFPFHFSPINNPHSTPHYPFFLPLNSTNYNHTLFAGPHSENHNTDILSSDTIPHTYSSSNLSNINTSSPIQPDNLVDISSIPVSAPTRQSNRIKQPPAYLSDYFCSHVATNNWCNIISYSQLPPMHQCFIAQVSAQDEPRSYSKAIQKQE